MNPIVELQDLTVRYPNKEAVSGLNLSLSPGEILGIAGPNGSGKTSTLSCIEGLQEPASGSVRVFSLNPYHERQRVYTRLGVQLQEASYPLRIRVGELCELFASFYDRPADWRTLLEALDLAGAARRSVQTLSGGEKQKLSVLLALMGRPELLILDELSTGLDPQTRHVLRTFLRSIAAQGVSMILVTHYLGELEDLADRLLLLKGGRPEFLGTPVDFRQWALQQSGNAAAGRSLDDAYLAVVSPAASLPPEVVS